MARQDWYRLSVNEDSRRDHLDFHRFDLSTALLAASSWRYTGQDWRDCLLEEIDAATYGSLVSSSQWQ